MDPPTKEHIKYQFCNVYNDLLSDLRSFSNVRRESVTSNSGDEITYAPNPEVKNLSPVSVYKTRGRSRKSEPEDIFCELKASRSKKKPSSLQSDITANFETKQDNKLQVTADVHRDASQPSEESVKIEAPTSDEVFDSLRGKRPSEFEITCSQESSDFLPVTKKSRKSYPGASVAKVNALHSAKKLSYDTEREFERPAKKLSKKLGSCVSKSFPPNVSPGSTEYNSDSDKFRSSPGWSRVKAVAKDFKDSSRKLLDISSSKPKLSKTSTTVSVTPKAGNSSVLNTSTSDSDQSDVRYFDSPNAGKRYQLMKHVVDVAEGNKVSLSDDCILVPDPVSIEDLKQAKEEFVKKLCESVNTRTLKRKREETIDNCPNSKDQQDKREVLLKSVIHGVKQSESPLKAEKPSTSALDGHEKTSLKSPNKVEEQYDFVESKTPNKQLKSPLKAQKSIQNRNQNELLNSPLNLEKSPDFIQGKSPNKQLKSPLKAQRSVPNRNQTKQLNSSLKAEKSSDSIQGRSPNKQLKSPLKAQNLVQNKNQTEQLNSPLKNEKSSESIQTRNLTEQFNSPLKAEKPPDCDKSGNRNKQSESPLKAKKLSDSVHTRNLNKELKSPLKAGNLASPEHVQIRNQNKELELPLTVRSSPVSDQNRNRNKQLESPMKTSSLLLSDSVRTRNQTEQFGTFIEALELSPTKSAQGSDQIQQFASPPKAKKSFDSVRARNKIVSSPDPKKNPVLPLKKEKSSDSIRVRNRNKITEMPDVPTPEKNIKSPLKAEKSCDSIRTRNQNKITESPDVSMPEKNIEPLLKAEKSSDSMRARNRNKIAGLPDVLAPENNSESQLKAEKCSDSVRVRNRNKIAGLPDVSAAEINSESLLKAEKSSDSVRARNRNKVVGPPNAVTPEKKLKSPLKVDKSSDSVRAKNRNKIAGPPDVHALEKNLKSLPKAEKPMYPTRSRNQRKIGLVSGVPVPEKNAAFESNTDESVVCLGEFDFDQSQSLEGVTQNEKSNTCGKPVGIPSEKDGLLELSNCDVSEAPLSSNRSSGVGSITRRKLNVSSKDLENALTQVISSSVESSISDKPAYEATIPLNSAQNLCSRCNCAFSDFNSSQNDGSNRTEDASTEENKNKQKDESKPKVPLVDASVQTDDVLVTEIRSSKETYVQTSPTSQALETVPCKDKTDEKIIRMKDEYILQTLKSLMIQASHKLTINDLYNLGFEQENEPPRKKLREITVNNSQSLVKFEDDMVRNENLPLQAWSLSANRGITNDNALHPPPDLKTPQNQGILRKTTSDMKYSLVSTPSSSERKLLDDAKFLNRSTVCSKDVTICETEETHPAEDSISKDVVPMEVEDDFPNAIEVLQSKTNNKAPNPMEIEISKLDIVRIRDKTNSSSSNDSLVFSSRKSAHRSLNFQHFFTKVTDSPPKAENVSSQLHFSNDDVVGSKHTNDGSKRVTFSFNSRSGDSNLPHNQIDDLEYSDDIRKSLSVFPECMDTQKPDGDTEGGIVENSDEDSIIQATPKKVPLPESSLTPDMLSSQNSQTIKEEDTDFHPAPEPMSTNSRKFIISDADNRQCQTDYSALRQSNSNIDSQVNEIPSSLIEDCFPKQPERRNSLYNIPRPNHIEYQEVHSSQRPTIPEPVSSVTNKGRDVAHISGYVIRSPVVQKLNEPSRLFITTSGLTNVSKLKVQEFCKYFNCVCESNVTDRTTHLVIKAEKNRAVTTLKYIVAVAMHKVIVTVDWMAACLVAKNILPEDPYIPLSSTGRAGPLNSLLSRSNPASLFKDFIIHIVPPFDNFTGKEFNEILTWCGAKIAETYAGFTSDDSRVRLVLINREGAEEKSSFYREVMLRYKAFILSHDWAIESVSNYKIEPFCTYNPLSAVYSSEMVNQFQIPDYIRDLASRYFESEDFDDTMSEMSNLP